MVVMIVPANSSTSVFVSALLNGNNTGNQIDIPKQVDQFLLEQLVSEQLGGFLLILSGTGKIIFVSSSVENLLGHLQVLRIEYWTFIFCLMCSFFGIICDS